MPDKPTQEPKPKPPPVEIDPLLGNSIEKALDPKKK